MKKLFILCLVSILATFQSSGTRSHPERFSEMPSGARIQMMLVNGNDLGFLETCGTDQCATTTRWNVMTNTSPNRAMRNTATWKIILKNGQQRSLSYGDVVYLENQYVNSSNGPTYLETCGRSSCGGSLNLLGQNFSLSSTYNVVTDQSKNRANRQTAEWKLLPPSEDQMGTPVYYNSVVVFENMYNGGGNYLQICGVGETCGGGMANISVGPKRTVFSNWFVRAEIKEDLQTIALEKMNFVCWQPQRQKTASDRGRSGDCSGPQELHDQVRRQFGEALYQKFQEACKRHDACYASPWEKVGINNGQAQCDQQFYLDLRAACSGYGEVCYGYAQAYYGGVVFGGFIAFNNGQEWAEKYCSGVKR